MPRASQNSSMGSISSQALVGDDHVDEQPHVARAGDVDGLDDARVHAGLAHAIGVRGGDGVEAEDDLVDVVE